MYVIFDVEYKLFTSIIEVSHHYEERLQLLNVLNRIKTCNDVKCETPLSTQRMYK